jgi:hypothetical protein
VNKSLVNKSLMLALSMFMLGCGSIHGMPHTVLSNQDRSRVWFVQKIEGSYHVVLCETDHTPICQALVTRGDRDDNAEAVEPKGLLQKQKRW